MDTPTRHKSGEATGVSRSGRVRKKSSKLTDFESPDEIDTRYKRKADRPPKAPHHSTLKPAKAPPAGIGDHFDDSDSYMDDDIIDVKDEPLEMEDWGGEDDGEEDEEEEEEEEVGGSVDPLQVDEDSTDMPRETSSYSQAQSLYFSEKQGKKNIVLKDGQLVRRKKAQRKDKGKSRFTAYMLWAREVRPGIIQANPNMDSLDSEGLKDKKEACPNNGCQNFSAVNKRLGELWALVSNTQKYNWKRRAKRLAAKGNQKGSIISTGKGSKGGGARSNIINKGGGRGGAGTSATSRRDSSAPPPTHTLPHKQQSTPKANRGSISTSDATSPPSTYKVTGTSPIDVAAHIKLLGESLNNIGQKLKEHEGQIAVSGSLSVLLDSMLCVLGPLTCLTAHVPPMRGAVPDATLVNILDNIAYIMPGIV